MRWPWQRRAPVAGPTREPELAPSASPALLGWWFAPSGPAPSPGRRDVDPVLPAPGERGLHAARSVLDALDFARSSHLCRVRLSGELAERGPLIAATERTIVGCLDPAPLLRSILDELAREALGGDPPSDVAAACERAREEVVDAERRIADLEWRLERRSSIPPDATRDARAAAARAKARLHALDALRIGTASSISELGRAIDLALRAIAWAHAAAIDALTATDLDRETERVRAEWARSLDDRVLAILDALAPVPPVRAPSALPRGEYEASAPAITSALGADRAAPPAEPPLPARAARTPTPVTIAPLRMDLPAKVQPAIELPSPPAPRATSWVELARDVVSRQAACTRAAILRDLTSSIVIVVEPFDYAAWIVEPLTSLRAPDATIVQVLALAAPTIDRSGPDVWASTWLADELRARSVAEVDAMIARALADPTLDRAPSAIGRLPVPEHVPAQVVADPFARATTRCRACGALYEIPDGAPLASARCGCGTTGLDRIGTLVGTRPRDVVRCARCDREIERPVATRHVICPGCRAVGVPTTARFADARALRDAHGKPEHVVVRRWTSELARLAGIDRAAWLGRDPLRLVIEASSPDALDAAERALREVGDVDALLVLEGGRLEGARALGALADRLAHPALPSEVASAWRARTFWSLPGIDDASRRAGSVATGRVSCCRALPRIAVPAGISEVDCGRCGARSLAQVDPDPRARIPLVSPTRMRCAECSVDFLVWTDLPDVVCPVCFALQAARAT